MIEDLLPACVRSVETYADRELVLLPAEAAAIARAVPKRRREFTSVRACATEALAQMGFPRKALVPGPAGAPEWPTGVVGSMTHCVGFRAAAVARRADVLSIGIDAEPNGPLPAGVLAAVARPEERQALERLPDSGVAWDRLLFSAKEAVYKTWYPLLRAPLGFADATVALGPDGTFTAAPSGRAPRGLGELCGRWRCDSGLIVTVISVAAQNHISKVVRGNDPFDLLPDPDDIYGDLAGIA